MKRFLSYILVFLVGAGIGYFTRDLNKPIKKEKTRTTVITETIDTADHSVTIAAKAPGKLTYIIAPIPNGPETPLTPGEESLFNEEVAAWDTVTKDGFVANIKYYTKQKLFDNYFEIPERIITKARTETITETEKVTETVYKLPDWELGVGVRGWIDASASLGTFNYAPYLLLQYNMDLWLVNVSLGGNGVAVFEQGKIKLIPEVNAEIKISL